MRNRPHASIAVRLIVGAIVLVGAVVLATTDLGGSGDEPPPSQAGEPDSGDEVVVRSGGDPGRDRRESASDPSAPEIEAVFVRRGIARRYETGEPVPGATVRVLFEDDPERMVVADEEGRFTIPFDREGSCQIVGFAEGFVCEPYPALRISSESESGPIELLFRAPASLVVRVVDQEGRAIEGAEVEAALGQVEGRPHWTAFSERSESRVVRGTTDAEGEAFLRPLIPGSYGLIARADGFHAAASVLSTGSEPFELRLSAVQPGLRVRVVDADGELVSVKRVWLEASRRDLEGPWSLVEEQLPDGAEIGEFDVAVRVTRPVRVVVAPDGYPFLRSEPVAEPIGGEVELRVTEGFEITGRVVDSSGQPIGQARVAEVGLRETSRFAFTETDESGRFVLHLPDPPIRLRASALGYFARERKFVSGEGRTVDLDDLSLESGVEVTAGGARVDGEIEGLQVSLQGLRIDRNGPRGRGLETDGSGRWHCVAPGEGVVRWQARARGERRLVDVVEPVAVTVDPRAGDPVEVRFPLEALPLLRVRFTIDGTPARFALLKARHREFELSTESAGRESGEYVVRLPPGAIEIGIQSDARNRFVPVADYQLESGSAGRLDLELRTARVQGRLIDRETGRPAPHSQVTMQVRRGGELVTLGSFRADSDGVFDSGPRLVHPEDFASLSLLVQTRIHELTEISDISRFDTDGTTQVGDVMLERGCELAVLMTGEQDLPAGLQVVFVRGDRRITERFRGRAAEFDGLPAGSAELVLLGADGEELGRRPVALTRGLPNLIRWTL
ncbi:MAG: carboxypeptidase-like regulatory domain-containing protein [Planctomycetota bacterium]